MTTSFYNPRNALLLSSVQQALESWPPTQNLEEARICLIALEIIRSLTSSVSSDPSHLKPMAFSVEAESDKIRSISPFFSDAFSKMDFLSSAQPMDFKGIKGWLIRKELGPVVYLSSKVEGFEKRILKEGSYKKVSQGLKLELSQQSDTVLSSCIALLKPKLDEKEASFFLRNVANLKKEVSLLRKAQEIGLRGLTPLEDFFSYTKGGTQKERMVLPWYDMDGVEALESQLTPIQKYSLLHQVLQILVDFEEKDWVYRDLKPSNLLVKVSPEKEIEVVFCDVGFVCGPQICSPDILKGTLGWLSPEYAYVLSLYENDPNRARNLGYIKDIKRFTTQKLDIWGFGMLCALILNPNMYKALFNDRGYTAEHRSYRYTVEHRSRWYQDSCINEMQGFRTNTPQEQFLKTLLKALPEERPSASEALTEFRRLFIESGN